MASSRPSRASSGAIGRLIAVFTLLLCVAWPSSATAQPTIANYVGQAEIIAVATDSHGDIYFATDRPGAIFKKNRSTGVVTLVAGTPGGSTDDDEFAEDAAVFPGRNGLAIDSTDSIFFSEPSTHHIRRIDGETRRINTVAGSWSRSRRDSRAIAGGPAASTDFAAPGALAFDPVTGDLYVADEIWDIVYRISTNGAGPIDAFFNAFAYLAVGGNPSSPSIYVNGPWYNPFGYSGDAGPAINARLNHPRGLAFDSAGNLYIADTGNNVIRRVDTAEIITTFAGTSVPGFSGDGSAASAARLFMPAGVAVDAAGNVLIADTANQRVRRVTAGASIITTLAGNGVPGHAGDGFPAATASLAYPLGVAVDATGNAFIADSQNNRLRGVAPDSTISTILTTGPDYAGDGLPGGNAVNQPQYVAIDHAGNVFFSDSGNSRVRRVDAQSRQVTTIAGNGMPGNLGDQGVATAARLNCPAGLVFNAAGHLFIADPCANVVRRVDAGADGLITGSGDEIITTYAGNGIRGSFSNGEGGSATQASLNAPLSLAMDSAGNLFIGEDDIAYIRKVDAATGILTSPVSDGGSRAMGIDSADHWVVADNFNGGLYCNGQGLVTNDFSGLSDEFYSGFAFGGLGTFFVSQDRGFHSVLQFTPISGTLCSGEFAASAIAGTGSLGYTGDNGPAANATLNHPAGLAAMANGTLFIADAGNNVIRRVVQPVVAVSLDVSSLTFGTEGLNATSQAKLVTATSTGSNSALFGAATIAGANPGDFTIVADSCAGALIPTSGTCHVSVAFRPTQPGARSALLQINDNASGSPQTVGLSGTGASLAVSPASIDFGAQTQGVATAPSPVTVTNTTAGSVTILSLTFTGAQPADFTTSSDSCTGNLLAAHASCTASVIFTPHGVGSRGATLNVNSTAADSSRTASVGGTGIAAVPAAVVAPASVAFGPVIVGSSSAGVTATLTSTGSAPLSVSGVSLGGDQPGDFVLSNDTCTGASIAPGQSCSVLIRFAPREICSATAIVSFADNAADSPQTARLSGTATAGVTGRFESALYCTSFGAQPQELAAGTDGRVWFDEFGSRFAPGAIATVTAEAGVQEHPDAVQFQFLPTELTFAPDGSYAYVEGRGPGFPLWLDLVSQGLKTQYPLPGNAGPVGVGPDGAFWYATEHTCPAPGAIPLLTKYAPGKAPVDYTPTLPWLQANTSNHVCAAPSVVTAGPDGTVWVGLQNTTGPTASSPIGFLRVSTSGVFIDFIPTTGYATAATLGADGNLYALVGNQNSCGLQRFDRFGAITPIPTQVGLASFLSCHSITSGPDGQLWMIGAVFNGTDFVVSMIGVDPLNGAVNAYRAPATQYLTAGPDQGIWFNSIPSAVGRFDIGGGSARAFASPKALGFPATALGVPSGARIVTVRSTGTGPLTISGVSLGGADPGEFVLSDGCSGAVLQPGASCEVLVSSRPIHNGSHAATLIINDDDTFSPQVVRLEEFTLPAPPVASPATVAFPSTLVGQHSSAATLTLSNPANKPLNVSSVSLSGANAGDFSILVDHCSGTSVPAGGTCTVSVWFAPTVAGARTATVTFTDSANPPAQSVSLSGGGQNGSTTTPCACAKTGLFVDPAVVAPKVSVTATSPHGLYKLMVTPGGPNGGPSLLTVTTASGAPVMTFTPHADSTWPVKSAWGFSPDDKRFAVHFQSNGEDWIELFDLTSAHPGTPAWSSNIPIAPGGTVTSPAGSMAFSPHGDYFVAAQLQSPVGSTLQTVFMSVVPAAGGTAYSTTWSPARTPAAPHTKVDSAFWGFSPDDQSFTFIQLAPDGIPTLTLVSLPTRTVVQQVTFTNSLATYVQFAPCGEVLGLVNQATDPITVSPPNPVTITLYSTKASDAHAAAVGSVSSLPVATMQLAAGPANYTAELAGWPTTVILAPRTTAAGCPAPTTSGSAGGLAAPDPPAAPLFTALTPPTTAVVGQPYTYTFEALGSPDPTFALKAFGPPWLTIDEDSGKVTGKPPVDTTSFTYSVVASNAVGFDDVGPFVVTVSATPTMQPALAAVASARAASSPLPSSAVLLLPNGRGELRLAADITPAVSIFTYAETDAPSQPLGSLVFAGLHFTFAGIDAASGVPVALIDAPRATIAFSNEEIAAARIRDLSTLGLFWWNGNAWVNQLPCAGCVLDADAVTLTVTLAHLGEYVLAAAPPPTPTLTITAASIHATAGVDFAGTIATFDPGTILDTVNQYAAMITWGDGQIAQGSLSDSGAGTYIVSATHNWAASGNYAVGITILNNGASQTVQTTAVVGSAQTAPQFTAATPPLTGTQGVSYTYQFAASGRPTPTFALGAGAPAWLSIGPATGIVSGMPPSGTTSFSFSVIASNGVSPDAATDTFVVAVSPVSNQPADLSVVLIGPRLGTKHSTVTYLAVVTNAGPATARDSVLVFAVGPEVSIAGETPSTGYSAPGALAWAVPALEANQSAIFSVRVTLSKSGAVLAIAAVGSQTNPDPTPATNVRAVLTIVN